MPKGHNQEHGNDDNAKPIQNTKGQAGHLKNNDREKASDQQGKGRNAKEDQSGGTKGANNV